MDGRIKKCICIKFSVKLGKSATKTLQMLQEAFGAHSLSQTVIFLEAFMFQGWMSCQLKMTNVRGDKAPTNRQKMLKTFEN
jgi:acyl-CoA thioesterase